MDLGLRVSGLGFRVSGQGLQFKGLGSRFGLSGGFERAMFEDHGSGHAVRRVEIRVRGSWRGVEFEKRVGFRIPFVGFQYQGFWGRGRARTHGLQAGYELEGLVTCRSC